MSGVWARTGGGREYSLSAGSLLVGVYGFAVRGCEGGGGERGDIRSGALVCGDTSIYQQSCHPQGKGLTGVPPCVCVCVGGGGQVSSAVPSGDGCPFLPKAAV
jgi:hypothetical protein